MADQMEKYKEAADEYITSFQLMQTPHIPSETEVPLRPKRNSQRSPGSIRSVGSTRTSTSSGDSSKSSIGEHEATCGEEDLPFDEYLKKKGLNDKTIERLKEEDISDIQTLETLTEDDIDSLGLKLGQKAKVRSLTGSVKRRTDGGAKSNDVFEDGDLSGELALQCFCLEEDGKGKVVAEITTKHTDSINPIKTRILILVDVSGSMGIKTGRKRRYSKLYRIKGCVKNMVTALDVGDFAGLVTFGEHADVLLPMTEITAATRDELKHKVDTLDKCYLSTKTNISAGLLKALEVFRDASTGKGDLLRYRNAIIIFSDGEVNAGTQEPSKLVHEVRERIRQLSFGLEDSLDQWVSISTVVLGRSASEVMFCLSKFCSSDSFYTIDLDVDKPNSEHDLFLPVLMRKAAVAWNVSVNVEALNGAILKNEECSQENKVRNLKQSTKGPRTMKSYFYYDIPAASSRHIGISLDIDDAYEEEVLKIKAEYSGFSGQRKTIITTITKNEIIQQDKFKKAKAITENYKNDARMISEEVLNKAATQIKSGNSEESAESIEKGKSNLQILMNKYGNMASQEEKAKTEIFDYAKSLMANMESLLSTVKTTPNDEESFDQAEASWLKIKAVSSAISREAPTLAETLDGGHVLCPLPVVRSVASAPMRGQMQKVYEEQGVRESMFFDFDGAIRELKASMKEKS